MPQMAGRGAHVGAHRPAHEILRDRLQTGSRQAEVGLLDDRTLGVCVRNVQAKLRDHLRGAIDSGYFESTLKQEPRDGDAVSTTRLQEL